MDAKPRPREEGIFAHGMGIQVILQGIMFGILSLAAFWIGCTSSGGIKAGRTMAFLVLGCSQIFHAFNMRSAQSLFRTGIFTNRKLNLAAMTSIILMACVLYIPLLSQIFGLTTLPARMYGTGFALALFPIAALELVKALGLIAK